LAVQGASGIQIGMQLRGCIQHRVSEEAWGIATPPIVQVYGLDDELRAL
jgi:hypothetical protein